MGPSTIEFRHSHNRWCVMHAGLQGSDPIHSKNNKTTDVCTQWHQLLTGEDKRSARLSLTAPVRMTTIWERQVRLLTMLQTN